MVMIDDIFDFVRLYSMFIKVLNTKGYLFLAAILTIFCHNRSFCRFCSAKEITLGSPGIEPGPPGWKVQGDWIESCQK